MSKDAKREKPPVLLKVLVVLAVASVVIAIWLPALLGIRYGAPWLPKESPQESRRVTHPKGFSIIPPPGWVVKIADSGKEDLYGFSIAMTPGSKGLRYAPGIHVKTLESTPNLSEFHEITFSGMKAYERTVPVGNAERPCLRHELVVTHNAQWYEVGYYAERFRDNSLEVPEMMMLYIRSFKPAP
jgi:hypothetical protein